MRSVRTLAAGLAASLLSACLASASHGDDAGVDGGAELFADCRVGPVEPLRIAPVGDSITQAFILQHSYRYFLWEHLRAARVEADFIGTQFQHYGGTRGFPDPTFDQDHEGHWGESAVTYLALFDSRPWPVAPDVALVHLGTNDTTVLGAGLSGDAAVTQALSALTELIERLRSRNPDMHILLAQIMPIDDLVRNEQVGRLNRGIEQLAADRSTERSPVWVVDQNSGFEPATHSYDGLHPNEAGERMLAQRWFQALKPLLARHRACALGGAGQAWVTPASGPSLRPALGLEF